MSKVTLHMHATDQALVGLEGTQCRFPERAEDPGLERIIKNPQADSRKAHSPSSLLCKGSISFLHALDTIQPTRTLDAFEPRTVTLT
jgi:hypothetical protein